jgi:hypothetical protein
MVVEFERYECFKSEKELNDEYLKRLEIHLKEKEIIDKKLLQCMNCKGMYYEPENTETSCNYHSEGIYHKKVNYDDYDDFYSCCDAPEYSKGCIIQKHSNK